MDDSRITTNPISIASIIESGRKTILEMQQQHIEFKLSERPPLPWQNLESELFPFSMLQN